MPTAILAASLALRPPLTAVGPLIPTIQKDLSISHAVAGLIPGLIVLFMGVSSLFAPAAVRQAGWFRVTAVALVVAAAAAIARAGAPSAAGVVLLSVPIGIGAGVAGTALPSAVIDVYPTRGATGAGINALGINIGAAGAAALAVPISDWLGGWRGAFLCFALVGLASAVAWVVGARRVTERTQPERIALPLRDRGAWSLTTLFALQGLCFYGLGAWLPDAYVERGWSQSSGGDLVAVITAAAVPASFIAPRLSDRVGSRLLPLVVSAVGLFIGAVALTVRPGLAWPSVVVVGLSLGGLFSMCLLLAIDLGRPTGTVAAFAGMMFGLGYMFSAAAPITLGLVRDAAGSFTSALWLIVGIAALILGLLVVSRRDLTSRSDSLVVETAAAD
jgi:CP family cyanate transporter-like MFS transporter